MASFQSSKINPVRLHTSQIKFFLILIAMAAFMLLPLIFILFNAFKPMDELFAFPPRFLVHRPTMANFHALFSAMTVTGVPVDRFLLNSIVTGTLTVIFTIVISISAGYALSKKKFKLKKFLFEVNTLALMFVPIAVSIPRYIVIVQLGLIDQFFAHILPMLAMPVGLFLIKQFVDQVPDSLLEAAQIDGANDWFIIKKVVYPMTKPAIATVAILAFQAAWNSTEASSMYIDQENLRTFAFYMSTLAAPNVVAGMGMAAASALIMFIPNLIIFIIMQGQVMNTMAHSGLK